MGTRENVITGLVSKMKSFNLTIEPTLQTDTTAEFRIGKFYYIYPIEAYTEFKQKCQFCGQKKFMPCKNRAQANKC